MASTVRNADDSDYLAAGMSPVSEGQLLSMTIFHARNERPTL